jgi:non-heme chloroperoxidase
VDHRIERGLGVLLTLVVFSHALVASQPHVRFVQVDNNVRLEVLDWGGTGKTIVLLAGGGNTAHVFDDFAEKLTRHYHVVGITRRGFGASTFAPVTQVSRLADDVLAVMDTLRIAKAFLVGHSIAGAELSAIGASRPERVSGLIYIEAGYPYAFPTRDGPTMQELMDANAAAPPTPKPLAADKASFAALRRWDAKTLGFQMPVSEFRQMWDSTSDGRPAKERDAPGFASMMTILGDTTRRVIRVPAIVMFAIPHVHEPWLDARDRSAATRFFARLDSISVRQVTALRKNMPSVRVVVVRGTHYLFSSNAEQVIREIRAFTARLN